MKTDMKKQVTDRKNWIVYLFWSMVNWIVLKWRFRRVVVHGQENLPPKGKSFILIANHTARWDGLLLYRIVDRPANFMVSPNELRGYQGAVLRSMGAFPASLDCDLHKHIRTQISKGEPIIIFPEGDIYRDGKTHNFKSGAARFALNCAQAGLEVPIVPAAIKYDEDSKTVHITVAQSVPAIEYLPEKKDHTPSCVRSLSQRLFREVCHLRYQMGSRADSAVLFPTTPQGWFDPNAVHSA